MKATSILRRANFNIIKVSFAYSALIIFTVSIVAYFNFRSAYQQSVKDELKSLTNSITGSTLRHNYPSLIKEIQQRTNLQEIILYSKNCELLAATTLSTQNICNRGTEFENETYDVNSQTVKIYYKLNINYFFFMKKNIKSTITLYILIFLITTLIIFSIFYVSFVKPLNSIKSLINEETILLPEEFSFLGNKIIDLKNQIQSIEKERQYFKIARRVVHDIRNPLLYLKTRSIDGALEREEICNKIDEIEFHIMSLLKSNKNDLHSFTPLEHSSKIINEIERLFKLSVTFKTNINGVLMIPVHPYEWKNILLNLARNSFEAGASSLVLKLEKYNDKIELEVLDNGPGVEEEYAEKLFTSSVTTKAYGNGIGLQSIHQLLKSIGGKIRISKNSKSGLGITIQLPYFQNISSFEEFVLIDNDKFIHLDWQAKATKKGLRLHSFYSIDDFLSNISISTRIPIFVDSELGTNVPGEIDAERIYQKGYRNIHLSTNYNDIDITKYPWISSIVSKSSPV